MGYRVAHLTYARHKADTEPLTPEPSEPAGAPTGFLSSQNTGAGDRESPGSRVIRVIHFEVHG